jgi:hypothetical protein
MQLSHHHSILACKILTYLYLADIDGCQNVFEKSYPQVCISHSEI